MLRIIRILIQEVCICLMIVVSFDSVLFLFWQKELTQVLLHLIKIKLFEFLLMKLYSYVQVLDLLFLGLKTLSILAIVVICQCLAMFTLWHYFLFSRNFWFLLLHLWWILLFFNGQPFCWCNLNFSFTQLWFFWFIFLFAFLIHVHSYQLIKYRYLLQMINLSSNGGMPKDWSFIVLEFWILLKE